MLNTAAIINLIIVGLLSVGLCFALAHFRIALLARNKFGVFIIYLFELLLCIPAGLYTETVPLRIIMCISLLFTIFASMSHFLENTDDKFLRYVYRFSDAMIAVCILDLTLMLLSRFTI
jgi:hypothetical protein